uniref:Gamma-aminobutyric acid receptor-associated protein-like 2 n=1 Tax=Saimiri boliviensis boliviensis TaxID=39432 RepID=A0A2K6TY55_SAIBB
MHFVNLVFDLPYEPTALRALNYQPHPQRALRALHYQPDASRHKHSRDPTPVTSSLNIPSWGRRYCPQTPQTYAALRARVAKAPVPRAAVPRPRVTLRGRPGEPGDRTAAAGTPERGPGLCARRRRRRAEGRGPTCGQARPSAVFVSPTEHRCVESAKIRAKYPDRVPVIVEKVSGSQIVDIDKRKYLVPSDITVAQFMWIIRKRIQLPSEKAIFLFVDKTVPQSSLTMGQLYEKEKDEDGFLYVAYSGENTFGF